MTREEAIQQLQNCKDLIKQDGQDYLDERDVPILDMAIEALSAEPSGDLISRADAIEAVCGGCDHYYTCRVRELDRITECEQISALSALPSADRPQGEWINNEQDVPICSKCGYFTPYDRAIDDYEYGNYCPNCGARMESK